MIASASRDRDFLAPRKVRIAAVVALFQILLGAALVLSPGSMKGYGPVLTLPVVFSLLPGSSLVAFSVKIVLDQYELYLEHIHYVGPTPDFFPVVWVPAVLAIGGIVALVALSAVKRGPSRFAYWTLVIAELSCLFSPLGLWFFGLGGVLVLGLIPALVPLSALAFLIQARYSRAAPREPRLPARGSSS